MASGLENEFVTLHEIVKAAKIRLNANIWDYLIGGTETETTLRRNRMALDSIAFKPRVLRDVSKIDPSSEILGKKIRLHLQVQVDLISLMKSHSSSLQLQMQMHSASPLQHN